MKSIALRERELTPVVIVFGRDKVDGKRVKSGRVYTELRSIMSRNSEA
jgi:hypothetical protein